MARHQQITFHRGHEVLQFATRYLERIRDVLDELAEEEGGERLKMLLRSVRTEHRNLLGSVERVLEDSSEKVRRVYAQYTVEMPAEVEPPEGPVTTLALVQWLEHLLEPVHDMFEELAGNEDSEEASEVFGGLAQQIQSHSMRLSKEYQRTEDL